MMAEGLQLAKDNRHSLVGAALTANLGMFEYFNTLVNRDASLTDQEQAYLRTHPQISHKLLLNNGIKDPLWLTTVLQHHERSDGSGYPEKLRHDTILQEASVLAAADTYIAMVTPRAYRKLLSPKVTLQHMYKTAVAQNDSISIGLIKQLGIYPPGTLVRLANQEIAVVVERNKQDSVAPMVAVIGNSMGVMYQKYVMRASTDTTHRIIDAYQPHGPIQIDMNRLWPKSLRDLLNDVNRSKQC